MVSPFIPCYGLFFSPKASLFPHLSQVLASWFFFHFRERRQGPQHCLPASCVRACMDTNRKASHPISSHLFCHCCVESCCTANKKQIGDMTPSKPDLTSIRIWIWIGIRIRVMMSASTGWLVRSSRANRQSSNQAIKQASKQASGVEFMVWGVGVLATCAKDWSHPHLDCTL